MSAKRALSCGTAALLALLLRAGPVHAASVYWDTSDTASTDFEQGVTPGPSNWVTSAGGATEANPPANNTTSDDAYFGTRDSGVRDPALTIDRSVKGLVFTNGGWTLSGAGRTLSIGATGIDFNAGSGSNVVSVSTLNVAANSTWTLATGCNLEVSSALTGSSTITLATAVSNTLAGQLTLSGNTTGYSGTLNAVGTDALHGIVLVNGHFSGSVNIGKGQLVLGANDALSATSDVRFGHGGRWDLGNVDTAVRTITFYGTDTLTNMGGTLSLYGGIQNTSGDSGGRTIANRVELSQGPHWLNLLATGSIALSGVIADQAGASGGLLMSGSGSGSVTLSNTNAYSGRTTVLGATLAVSSSGTLGSGEARIYGGRLHLAAAGNVASGQSVKLVRTFGPQAVLGLAYNGLPTISADSSGGVIGVNTTGYNAISSMASLGDGTMYLGSSGTGTFAGTSLAASGGVYRLGSGGGTLTMDSGGAGVLTGANNVVVGVNNLAAYTGGTVVLADANDFSGTITVNNGGLLEGRAQPVGGGSPFGASSSAVTLNTGALKLSRGSATVALEPVAKGAMTFTGSSSVYLDGNHATANVQLTVASLTPDGAYKAGLIVHPSTAANLGSREKLIVTAPGADLANDAHGMVKPYYQVYSVANDKPYFASYDSAGGTGFNPVAYTTTDLLTAGVNDIVYGGNNVTNNGTITVAALTLNQSGKLNGTGTVVVTSGGLMGFGDGRNGSYNAIDFNGHGGVIGTYAHANGTAVNLWGDVTNTGGEGIVKMGPYTLALTTSGTGAVAKTFTGTLTVLEGTVSATADSSFGDAGNDIVLNGGGLDVADRQFSLNANRTITIGPNGGSFNNSDQGREKGILGQVTGSGLLMLTGSEYNRGLVGFYNAANDWSGGLYSRNNVVRIADGSSLGSGGVFLDNGDIQAYGDLTIASLAGYGAVILGPTTGSGITKTLTVGDASSTEFFGAVRDQSAGSRIGAVTKAGAGTLTLWGDSTYTGATNVNAGTLVVNGSLASAVNVNNAATLGGSGTFNGLVTVGATAFLAPGNSPGTQTYAAGLDIQGTLNWELGALSTANPGADFDLLAVTGGDLTIGSASLLTVLFTDAATDPDGGDPFWDVSQSWTLIDYSGAGSSADNFSAVTNATWANGVFSTANVGGDVVLTWMTTEVPEPATLAFLAAGGLGMITGAAVRRRRRRSR